MPPCLLQHAEQTGLLLDPLSPNGHRVMIGVLRHPDAIIGASPEQIRENQVVANSRACNARLIGT